MDVVNANAVNGTFELTRYDRLKNDDRKNASRKDKYFWKQIFDFSTKSLLVRLEANRVRSDSSRIAHDAVVEVDTQYHI
jgi:hypothetical protein